MKQPLERSQVITLASLFVLIVVLALAFFLSGREESVVPVSRIPADIGPAPAPGRLPSSDVRKKVILFFASENDDLLHPEEREIAAGTTPTEEAGRVLDELIKGSTTGLVSTLPPQTRLRQVYLTKDGTACADFSKSLGLDHPSGSSAEIATVYAVVNSLAYNFKDVKRVLILIEGLEADTLDGHISLNKPLLPQYSLVAQ